ncbi:MAG: hypothetical protein WEA99_04650 [Brumimicrobium sp.]
MRLNQLLLLAIGTSLVFACKREGCTDQSATNYDKKAKNDDGSCVYDGSGGNGEGNSEDPDYNLTGTTNSSLNVNDIFENSSTVDYYVDGTWTIDAAVTIDPGVRILMKSGSRIRITDNGSLDANGTSSDKIYFIGDQDVEGFWDYIMFDGSNNPNNRLNHVVVKNGGGNSSRQANVYMRYGSRLILQNSTISKSEGNGLEVSSFDDKLIDFENNNFADNKFNPIKLNNWKQASEIDFATEFTDNNDNNSIYVGSGDVDQPITVNKVNGPFYATGSTSIDSDMEITEGVQILMGPGSTFHIKSTGSLKITGTASDRVVIEGDEQVEGRWDHILYDDSNSPNNSITYADISYGGGNSSRPANIYVRYSSQLSMGNSSCNYSAGDGVYGSSTITFNDLGGNTYTGNVGDDINLN